MPITDANLERAAAALRGLAIGFPDEDYAVQALHLSNELEWHRLTLAYDTRHPVVFTAQTDRQKETS